MKHKFLFPALITGILMLAAPSGLLADAQPSPSPAQGDSQSGGKCHHHRHHKKDADSSTTAPDSSPAKP